jgi:hypothetical protein
MRVGTNKLEVPRDKDEDNKGEIHEYDGRSHDPDTMVVLLTPKPTRRGEPWVCCLFIINRLIERYRQNLHMSVGVMKD